MLAELAVVEPDDQAQLGVETAGGQGGPDVGLVVAVDEGQRGGIGHATSASASSSSSGASRTRGGGTPSSAAADTVRFTTACIRESRVAARARPAGPVPCLATRTEGTTTVTRSP